MTCKKHPKYKAKREPRADCPACRWMRVRTLKRQFKRIRKEIDRLEFRAGMRV
jgi:hypothetical protein